MKIVPQPVFWRTAPWRQRTCFERNWTIFIVSQTIASATPRDPFILAQTFIILGLCAVLVVVCRRLLAHSRTRIDFPFDGRHNAKEWLRENRERLELVLDGFGLGLWDRDITTGRTTFNARWAEMLGHTLDEIEPHVDAWAQRLHPDDKAEVLRRLQDHLDGKIARFEAEYRLRTKSGGWCWVYALGKVSQWDAAGSPTRILGANQDISDLKRRNDEFKKDSRHNIQAQKLESLGALAGGVAHDFNNLLMGILGNANLLEDCIPPHSEARDYLGDIETSARRAAELCHQLLAYSGRANLVMEPIDVNATVRETEALMGASISKKIAVNYQFLDSVPAIDADASQIRQILINLFANAAEAIEDASGVITVSTGVMECDEDFFAMAYYSDNALPGTYSYIQVQDTGFGMSPDTLSRAFEPFFSTHASKRGLGLPAVLGIVLSHEGCIDIESEPRKGTRVRVLFPVSELKPARIDPQGHISAGTRMRGTVLVVDDEVTVRNVAKNMLTLLGLRVITAIDGRDAVQRYEEIEEDIACVLLDLTMPHMNGEEAFDALYKLDPSIRVIISSGYAEEEIAHRFEGRAIAGFIKKPYEIDALRDTVHRAITR